MPAETTVEEATEEIEAGETETVEEPSLVFVDVGSKGSDAAAGYSEEAGATVEEVFEALEEAFESLGTGCRLSEDAFAEKSLASATLAAEAAAEASSANLTAAEAEVAAAEAAETAFFFANSFSLCCLKYSSW